jgi:hypothetical protein
MKLKFQGTLLMFYLWNPLNRHIARFIRTKADRIKGHLVFAAPAVLPE